MEGLVAVASQYDDVEIDVFFESSEEDVDEGAVRCAAASAPSVPDASEPVSEADIAEDLRRLHAALEQQPFRVSSARGLQRMVRSQPTEEWLRLSSPSEPLDARVARSIGDVLQPALVSGLVDAWPARSKWSSADELARHYPSLRVCATRLVAAGDMGKPQPVVVRLASYLAYCRDTVADFPLYIFDHSLPSTVLSRDYTPPPHPLFARDVFDPSRYAAELREHLGFYNALEWVIMGPRLTSTPLHKDPLYTSAWNALLCGRKRWAIFPPHVPLEALRKGPDTEPAVVWFLETLPQLRGREELGLIEFTQCAGDTVFVPEGWWHAVVNVDSFQVAITHNCVLPESLPHIRARMHETHAVLSEHLFGASVN